jgi:DNA-binding response OmpR family regulator
MAKKILIIEDEEILAKILLDKFQNSGFEAKIAKDGDAALRRRGNSFRTLLFWI